MGEAAAAGGMGLTRPGRIAGPVAAPGPGSRICVGTALNAVPDNPGDSWHSGPLAAKEIARGHPLH